MSGFTLLGRLCVCPHGHGSWCMCATGLSALCGMREGTVRHQIIHLKTELSDLHAPRFNRDTGIMNRIDDVPNFRLAALSPHRDGASPSPSPDPPPALTAFWALALYLFTEYNL
jgi:hypothetical protein